MDTVILAGGRGTRLSGVIQDIPKPMAPIAGHPFLEILLANLSKQGLNRVVLSVGHLANKIIDYFGTHYGNLEIHYVVEDIPLGTGGALAAALPHCKSEHALILNGDTFLDLNIAAVTQLRKQRNRSIVVLREVPDTARYGRVDLYGERIIAFQEKGLGGPGKINAGCYMVPTNLMRERENQAPFSFETDFLPAAIVKEEFLGFVSDGLFIDIGIPEDYARAQILLAPWLP